MTIASTDYAYDFAVDVPRSQILAAVTDDAAIRGWWTAATRSERQGDEVRLFRDDAPFVSFTVDHTSGTDEVTWTVTGCMMDDWIGTQPSFSVQPNDDGTQAVHFRHVGLHPSLECFDQCRAGWNHFMPSLHQYLETGEGRPNEPRTP
jgi:hypothetical protein